MHRFIRIFKVMLASVLMTLMFSCSASSLSGKTFVGTDLIEVIVDGAQHLDEQVRGFGKRGFGMNFGGSGKSNTATVNKNTAQKNANAAQPTKRPGLLGFLGGLGLFSWLLLGAGLLGGGFLIYLLAMLLIPMIIGALAAKRKAAADDLPSSNYSSAELFKEQEKDKHQF